MKQVLLFGKKITFAIASKIERTMILAYGIFLLWFNVLFVQLKDNGWEHKVTWFGNIQSSAFEQAIIILILFHLILMALVFVSINSKATNQIFDYFIAVLTIFGVAMVLTGFLLARYTTNIHFLFIDYNITDFYIIGVALEVIGGLYYAFTK